MAMSFRLIIAHSFSKEKLFHDNILFTKDIFQFTNESNIQFASRASPCFCIGKINYHRLLTGEHIDHSLNLLEYWIRFTCQAQIQCSIELSRCIHLCCGVFSEKSVIGRARLITICGSFSSRKESLPVITTGWFSLI